MAKRKAVVLALSIPEGCTIETSENCDANGVVIDKDLPAIVTLIDAEGFEYRAEFIPGFSWVW